MTDPRRLLDYAGIAVSGLSGIWRHKTDGHYFVSFGDWVDHPNELESAVRTALGDKTEFADETEGVPPRDNNWEPVRPVEKAGTSEGAIKGWLHRKRALLANRSHLADALESLSKRKGPKADKARAILQKKISGIDAKVKSLDTQIKQAGKQAQPLDKASALKQRSHLADQLDSISNRKGPKAERAKSALQKKISDIDTRLKQSEKQVKQAMSPDRKAAMLKQRSHLADSLDKIQGRNGPKAEAAKAALQGRIDKIDQEIRQNPLPKPPKVSKPLSSKNVQQPAMSKRGPVTPTIPGGAETAVGGGAEANKGFAQKAFDWLKAADTKVGNMFTAIEQYAGTKFDAIASRLGHRQQLHAAYSDWSKRQANANNLYKQVKQEYNRKTSSGIPSRRFYELAVQYRQKQLAADGAKIRFEGMVGYAKSLVEDSSIEELESPYASH
jgi:hypothetical protein